VLSTRKSLQCSIPRWSVKLYVNTLVFLNSLETKLALPNDKSTCSLTLASGKSQEMRNKIRNVQLIRFYITEKQHLYRFINFLCLLNCRKSIALDGMFRWPWMVERQGSGKKRSWLTWTYTPGFNLERLRKTAQTSEEGGTGRLQNTSFHCCQNLIFGDLEMCRNVGIIWLN